MYSPFVVDARFHSHPTDFLHRFLRPKVLLADREDDVLCKPEGVRQHQVFHLPVVTSAPILSRQESESDLDLARLFVVPEETR
ncbi:MAG TPA: hypothetical protein VGW57_14540 [Chthoniobacterales bacterium]|nr:hypothetical protein [Chthoniobacterales bacterium]